MGGGEASNILWDLVEVKRIAAEDTNFASRRTHGRRHGLNGGLPLVPLAWIRLTDQASAAHFSCSESPAWPPRTGDRDR